MYLYALQMFPFAYRIEGFEVHRTEYHSRQVQTVQVISQSVCLYPRSGKHLERNGITHTNRHIAQFAEYPRNGIEESGMRMRDVWGRRNPLESCLYIIHFSLPPLHFHNMQVAWPAQHLFSIEHQCKLATSKSVKVRNFKLADKRYVSIFYEIPFYF